MAATNSVLGTRKNWLQLALFFPSLWFCTNYGGQMVLAGPLGIWQLGAAIATLALPALVLWRRWRPRPEQLSVPQQPAWKRRCGNLADHVVEAASFALLSVACMLAYAALFGPTQILPVEVLSVTDTGVRNRNCDQYAVLRLGSREVRQCLEGVFGGQLPQQGQIISAQVKTVPYGFLIVSFALLPPERFDGTTVKILPL